MVIGKNQSTLVNNDTRSHSALRSAKPPEAVHAAMLFEKLLKLGGHTLHRLILLALALRDRWRVHARDDRDDRRGNPLGRTAKGPRQAHRVREGLFLSGCVLPEGRRRHGWQQADQKR